MAAYKAEDFTEPFDATNFVERISANILGGGTKGGSDGFDPNVLKEHFTDVIQKLKGLSAHTEAKISKLELSCREQEQKHKDTAAEVDKQYKEAANKFLELDDRINSVATKVVHLGDQLENISIPRQRVQETKQVMKYFEDFHSGKETAIFKDPTKLHEAAAIIYQLHNMADELPPAKFDRVKRRIQEKYSTIETDLLREFVNSYSKGNTDQMAKCTKTLLPYKNYHQCYEELIKLCLSDFIVSNDAINDIVPACERFQEIANQVFDSNPEQVVAKFVQTIFEKKLAGYVYKTLPDRDIELENYLKTLAKLRARMRDVNKKLATFRLGSDSTFLERITKPVFQKYLATYIEDECQFLEEEYSSALNRFYTEIGHVKKEKTIGQNILSEMPDSLKELQRRVGNKAILKDNLLSQDVAVTLLQENKLAIRRCELLSRQSDIPSNVVRIFNILVKFLGEEHFGYAVEVTLQSLPPLDPKVPPDLLFLNVLYQSNTIFHLIEKHFTDYILVTVGSSPVYSQCANKKKALIDGLELKLNQGMERISSSMYNYLKFLLSSEQKKNDFRAEEDDDLSGACVATSACKKSCAYMRDILPPLRNSLDGKNLEVVLTEIGTKFHRNLLDHLYQFTFTSIGAMTALCDINEYRHSVKLFKLPLLDQLFSVLFALVDLLVVMPENLKEVGQSEQLAELDKTVLQQFVSMRADYKKNKLANVFV